MFWREKINVVENKISYFKFKTENIYISEATCYYINLKALVHTLTLQMENKCNTFFHFQ